MNEPISRKMKILGLALLTLTGSSDALAQRHAIADSSVGRSLLTAAVTLPSTYAVSPRDSAFARRFIRLETQYTRTSAMGVPSMLILGLRSDNVSRDSAGWNASVFGIRTGLAQKADGSRDVTLSAVELYFGGRTLGYLERPGWPNIGVEAVAGWSGIETRMRASFALRFPVEVIRGNGPTRVAFSVVPTMAWGQVRFRSCEDRGPGDNCGSLGIQLAAGRTRFVLGTGVTLAAGRGVSVTAGAQHMFARSQQPRFTLALGLGG